MYQHIKITKPAVIVSIGIFIDPTSIPPREKSEKLFGISLPKIVLPSDSRNAAPENTVKVPRVATNGKIPITETKIPLNKPPTKPTSKAAPIPAHIEV